MNPPPNNLTTRYEQLLQTHPEHIYGMVIEFFPDPNGKMLCKIDINSGIYHIPMEHLAKAILPLITQHIIPSMDKVSDFYLNKIRAD